MFNYSASKLPGLQSLWDESIGDSRVCVAVLDGSVDLSHPSFQGAQLTKLPTLVSDAPVGKMASHGTHIASVIFGQHGSPVQGIAPGCRGLIVPVFSDRQNRSLLQIDLARAINQAVEQGANVINISGGELSESGAADPILEKAVRHCHENGVLIIAAAGNNACECLHVPAALPSVLAVGAMNDQGLPIDFSNWGQAYQNQGILAPGENILGAMLGGGTTLKFGTSFATPIVSGLVALLMSIQLKRGEKPDPHFIRQALLESALPCHPDTVPDARRCLAGRLNIPGAYELITKGETQEMSNQNWEVERMQPSEASNLGSAESVNQQQVYETTVVPSASSGQMGVVPAAHHQPVQQAMPVQQGMPVHYQQMGVVPAGYNQPVQHAMAVQQGMPVDYQQMGVVPAAHHQPVQQAMPVQQGMPVDYQQMGVVPAGHHQPVQQAMPVQQGMPVDYQQMGVVPAGHHQPVQQAMPVHPVHHGQMGVVPAAQTAPIQQAMPVQQGMPVHYQQMGVVPAGYNQPVQQAMPVQQGMPVHYQQMGVVPAGYNQPVQQAMPVQQGMPVHYQQMGVVPAGYNQPVQQAMPVQQGMPVHYQQMGVVPAAQTAPVQHATPVQQGMPVHYGQMGAVPAIAANTVAPTRVTPSGVVPSMGCGCDSGSKALVYAIGTIGYDFGTEARQDSFKQLMPLVDSQNVNREVSAENENTETAVPANPFDVRQMTNYLLGTPILDGNGDLQLDSQNDYEVRRNEGTDNLSETQSLIWTLNLELTPIYAIEAKGPSAQLVYKQLSKFLEGQALPQIAQNDYNKGYIDKVSIPGILTGKTVQLFSGQVVPVLELYNLRGLYGWHIEILIQDVINAVMAGGIDESLLNQLIEATDYALRAFLQRIYYDLRNLGQTSQERAFNYAATNAFQFADALVTVLQTSSSSTAGSMQLDTIGVERSPFCRVDSDCWDVKLKFFDPENDRRAKKILRYTIDVSDIMPVTMGQPRIWDAL
ncbi:S8 family serine peptidase [Moorena sp. SIO3B2]|uniref:S8 family serine peptidase n=1 Tax=Moorena sp. SIO3B2 TaxID=2607827 RepID=UPI00257A31A8|nr:S8 family serine peptidase [Moorena sp. SIO3B2]